MSELLIDTYTASEAGLFVNSYLVETASGVVVVDANLLLDDIRSLVERVRLSGRPLQGVFVTHPHPDHFNGVLELVRGQEVPVYATAGVAQGIREVADQKRAQWGPVYGDQWPAETYYPTVELADGQQLAIDGVTFTAHELGPGESHADSYLTARIDDSPATAFIGDIAFHGMHPYTADGHTGAWLSILNRLSTELAGVRALLPGHGRPADAAVFDDQRRYLLRYRDAVGRLAGGATSLDDDAKKQLDDELQTLLPNAPLTWMIGLGADAVALELATSSTIS